MNETEHAMQKSLEAAKSAHCPVINIAAGLSPSAIKPAAKLPQPVEDAIEASLAVRFAFLGAGQGGGRICDGFWRAGYRRAAVMNLTNADFKGLSDALPKIDLGVGGAGKDAELARRVAVDRQEDIRNLLVRSWGTTWDHAMICASLGGGTGSGSAPVLVETIRRYAQDMGQPPKVGAVVSLPVADEGYIFCRNAVTTFEKLVELQVSPIIVIDNARVLSLYRPAVAAQHAKANSLAVDLLHLFNQLAAVHSPYVTFDRTEFKQLLASGIVTFGSADIPKFESPADVSGAIREQLDGNVLAAVDLGSGTLAACLFVAGEKVLESVGLDYCAAGWTAVARAMDPEGTKATLVHRGLYPGAAPGLQAYVMVGGLSVKKSRLVMLAREGGLLGGGGAPRVAQFLGVQD